MYEPIRGGTRGGQAEFKWSDVSADKDREHYLGHSINAPTGRWQKNKDVHWYARDKDQTEDEKAAELARIREAEREAMSVALGFGPSKIGTDATGGTSTSSGANAVPLGGAPTSALRPTAPAAESQDEQEDEHLSKDEKRLRKIEKKLAKIERKKEKQEEKERRAMQLVGRDITHKGERDRGKDRERDRHRDRDRDRNHEREREYDRESRRYRDKHSRERSASPRRGEYRSRRLSESSGGRRRSLTPLQEKPWMNDRKESSGDYGPEEMERERARDRRRWGENLERQEKARDSMAMRDMRY